MLYASSESLASLLEALIRESLSTILFRASHIAGASALLLSIYLHIMRSIRAGIASRSSQSS